LNITNHNKIIKMMRYNIFLIAALVLGLFACSSADELNTSVTSVALNNSTLTLVINEYETLTATVFPESALNKNVTWRSDDTEIATVDNNGRVTAVSAGTATITVQTVDGRRTATSRVTVRSTPVPPVAVTGVTLNRASVSLIVGAPASGGRIALTATVAPATATNQRVTWTSSNPGVATVSLINNIWQITAVSLGTATITVTTEDGNRTANSTISVVDGVWIGNAIWARSNVNTPRTFAANPEDAGMFFQWNRNTGWTASGDITSWNNSIPTGASWRTVNSPCPTGWRIPTDGELNAVRTARSTWATVNNVSGRRVSGGNNDSIFLPAAGWRSGSNGTLNNAGTVGAYWNSVQSSDENARGLRFDSSNTIQLVDSRANGNSVRCVAN
jgi:uncharacterized protein (TIGR02145 family)